MHSPTTFKTFEAKVYDETIHGKMKMGTFIFTVNDGQIDFNKLSDKATIEDLKEVNGVPVFDIFEFPDTSDLPAIDIQLDNASVPAPSDAAVDININMHETPDFQIFDTCLDEFNLTNEQEEALINDESVQWFPMNSPPGKLGIEVNELGEVRSINSEVHLMEGQDKQMRLSKYNKALGCRCFIVYIYREGKQKVYDFHLGMEVFKTFNPEYSAYQLQLRYENKDRSDCSLVNLSVDNFLLPDTRKGKSVTNDIVVLNTGDFWMDLVGNGNNIIQNYKVSCSGLLITMQRMILITVFIW